MPASRSEIAPIHSLVSGVKSPNKSFSRLAANMVMDGQTMGESRMGMQTAGTSRLDDVKSSFKQRAVGPSQSIRTVAKSSSQMQARAPSPWASFSKLRRDPISSITGPEVERPPLPHRSYLQWFFGCGPETQEQPASRLLHPLSPFGICWIGMTAVFLAYTAIVTPVTAVQ